MNNDDMWDDEDRAVLAHLPFDEVAPPPDLEERVMAAALARRPTPQSRSRRGQAILAGLAIAALVAGVVMIAVSHRTVAAPTRVVGTSATRANVDRVLGERGVRRGAFSDGGGRVALAPDGTGYLYDLGTPGEVTVAIDNVAIGKAQPNAGIVEIHVRHPEVARAITVTDASGRARSATLQP
jgi:hypothetical protein